MLSARALGALVYSAVSGVPPTVKNLEKAFTEGREAIRTAIKELEEAGFVERQNTKIHDRHIKSSIITDSGFRYLTDAGFWGEVTRVSGGTPDGVARVSGRLLQLCELNNPIHLYSQISKESLRGAQEEFITIPMGEEMPYEFFEKTSSNDEHLNDRQKYMAHKKKEYEAAKRDKQKKQMTRRQDIDPALWTSSDIGYEFADRLQEKWHIKPWSIVQTRFIPALAEMRKRLDTDGQVEVLMLNMFFESVDFQKYDDPQVLWKMFIKRAPELAPQALRLIRTPEQLAEAQVAADKSWDWMED